MSASGTSSRLLRYLIYLIIVGGIGLAAAWSWGSFSVPYDFRKQSSEVLRTLTSGKEADAIEAYNEAAFLFQEASLLTSFVDRVDRLTKVLGRFEEIESVEDVELLDLTRGKTARVNYTVRFRNVKTSALVSTNVELSYLQTANDKKKWRLLGFDISVPDALTERVAKIGSEYDRIKAPDEVVALVDETLKAIEAGKGTEVRENASPPFKESTTAERFTATLERYRKELGPYKRRLKIHSSGQNADNDRARVHVLLEFEKAKTSGNFEFIKVEDEWRLLHLKILIPEPFFPVRAP